MHTETTIPLNNETVTTPPKKQWATPAFEKIEIRLGKLGDSPDLTPPDDFSS